MKLTWLYTLFIVTVVAVVGGFAWWQSRRSDFSQPVKITQPGRDGRPGKSIWERAGDK
jgi:hypothetical protein